MSLTDTGSTPSTVPIVCPTSASASAQVPWARFAAPLTSSPRPRRPRDRPVDVLRLEEVEEALLAPLAAGPALARAAPGRIGPVAAAAVDRHRSGAQPVGDLHRLVLGSPDRRVQPVARLVREPDCLVERLVLHHDADRPEQLV